jgi:hypothetical protein
MATINKRIHTPQAYTINGVDAGGGMSARITEGYDQIFRTSPDGLQIPIIDRVTQFCRGSIETQDWVEMVNLLSGTLGTYVFYERKSGVAVASGYIKHTLLNPVIHLAAINLTSGDKAAGYATVRVNFECKAADENDGIADLHVIADSQAAPTYISAARGGIRILTTVHGAVSIYHVTALSLQLAIPLKKASNDGDEAYTAIDAELSGMTVTGSLTFQDAEITSAKLKMQDLILADPASLVATIRQSSFATNKVLTIAGVIFGPGDASPDVNSEYTNFTLPFEVTNDVTTQLTLAGANKVITIADAS